MNSSFDGAIFPPTPDIQPCGSPGAGFVGDQLSLSSNYKGKLLLLYDDVTLAFAFCKPVLGYCYTHPIAGCRRAWRPPLGYKDTP
jgi:hypothetical protein